MKKFLQLVLALMFISSISKAQTNATNFTAVDCNSQSHTLFTDLDNGKIVVLVWVMPCGSCTAGTKAAYDEVQKFATSNPGKVIMYLADDYGNTNCTTLKNWATSSSVGENNIFFFNNTSTAINEENYGGSGMPHVTVIGGKDHKIYYNKKNSQTNDPAGINSAITSALNTAGSNEILNAKYQVNIFPNPAKEKFDISFSLAETGLVTFRLIDLNGKIIFESEAQNFGQGNNVYEINCSGISKGTYTLHSSSFPFVRTSKRITLNFHANNPIGPSAATHFNTPRLSFSAA